MSFGVGRDGLDGFSDPVGDLGTVVDRLADLDPARMVDAELGTDLLRFARHRSREDAVFAIWTLAAVRRQVGVSDGYADTIGWLSWKTGKPRAELGRIVRLAELCELLPETGRLWQDGRITTTAVEMIAG